MFLLSLVQPKFDENAFILDRLNMGIPLEDLHDSLLQYFNILKNSLVELINQDYADFVNLSSNLFGLEKIIDSLEQPLVRVRSSVAVSSILLTLVTEYSSVIRYFCYLSRI